MWLLLKKEMYILEENGKLDEEIFESLSDISVINEKIEF